MFQLEILLLALALAMDAAIVSFAIGLLGKDLHLTHLVSRGFIAAFCFGFFQFAMTWLGSLGGHQIGFSAFGHYFQLLVSLVFVFLGGKLIHESFDKEHKQLTWGIGSLFVLSLVTSIDALASGLSLGTLPRPEMAALEIGIVTSIICLASYFLTRLLDSIPHPWLLRIAAMVFFYLGGDNIIKHFF